MDDRAPTPLDRPRRLRAFISSHRRPVAVAAVLLVGLVVFVLVWFQPQKLFIDETVDEAIPRAAAPRADEEMDDADQVSAADQEDTARDEERDPGPTTLASGQFRSLEHSTSGKATIVELSDGSRFLRLANLMTSNGPDLRVYLSEIPASDDWYAYGERFVDLGGLKGNVGNQNYRLPRGLDLSRYKSAVIWCRRFTVGFGVTTLDAI